MLYILIYLYIYQVISGQNAKQTTDFIPQLKLSVIFISKSSIFIHLP